MNGYFLPRSLDFSSHEGYTREAGRGQVVAFFRPVVSCSMEPAPTPLLTTWLNAVSKYVSAPGIVRLSHSEGIASSNLPRRTLGTRPCKRRLRTLFSYSVRSRRRFKQHLSSRRRKMLRMSSPVPSSASITALLDFHLTSATRYRLCEFYLALLELKVVDADRKSHCQRAKVQPSARFSFVTLISTTSLPSWRTLTAAD